MILSKIILMLLALVLVFTLCTAKADSTFELLTNEQKYDEYRSFYQFVQADTSVLSNSETDNRFRSLYDSLYNTHLSSFDSSYSYLKSHQSSLLSYSLSSITTSNSREFLIKGYLQVKKNELDSGYVLNSDSLWLDNTSSLSALDSGEVVFWTRNDLLEEIDDMPYISSSRIAKHTPTQLVIPDVVLIPNPGIEQFEIKTKGINVIRVLVQDATGSKVKYLENSKLVDVNNLMAGIYFVFVYFENGQHTVIKFVKIN